MCCRDPASQSKEVGYPSAPGKLYRVEKQADEGFPKIFMCDYCPGSDCEVYIFARAPITLVFLVQLHHCCLQLPLRRVMWK